MDQLQYRSSAYFNSFELNDSDITQTSLKSLIIELQQFFPDQPLEFDRINDLVDESISAVHENDNSVEFRAIPAYNVKFIKHARQNMRCSEALKSVRSLLDELKNGGDEMVNWNMVVNSEKFNVGCYLTFIYYLIKLFEVDPGDKVNKDLSFNAGRTYVSLLSLPGAKTCMVWDRNLIIEYFKLLNYQGKLKSRDRYLELQVLQMLNEIKYVFNVCLNDQEDVQEKYIGTICSILEHHLVSNNHHSAIETIMCCYDNLESLCLRPLPDKDTDHIMYQIFCRTVELHCIPSKKRRLINAKHGEAISDFFLYLLSTYSIKTKNALLKFIKSLLSNPGYKFEGEKKFLKLLDIAVKYELAIYWKCNESIIEYLKKLSMSADHHHRLNCVEFCGKMLLIDTTPYPTQAEIDTTELPREVEVIKILFERIHDKQDNVKLKALSSLKAGIVGGNDFSKKIFNLIFRKPSTNDNPEILNALTEAGNFQQTLLALLQHSSATYIRKTCLEILTHHCENLVDNEIFIDIIVTLAYVPSYMVKIQLLEFVNGLIKNNPKSNSAINTWLEVITKIIRDNDNKIVEAALKSLIAVFEKIESFENTITDEHLLPWAIVKMILAKQKRRILKSAIDVASCNILSQEKLRNIETHIYTYNRTEAWCILSMIAKKIKPSDSDIVIKIFLDHITERNYDTNDFQLILEVICYWIETFSVNSRAQMACKMTGVLESVDCPITIVGHLYDICMITLSSLSNDEDRERFAAKINGISKQFILDNFATYHLSQANERILCYMLIFCNSSDDLAHRPDQKIIKLFFGFFRKVLSKQLPMSVQNDIPRKLNLVIVCLTRFALCDRELAAELTPELAMLLEKSGNTKVIMMTIRCLTDLCKKHTSTVTEVFEEIVYKLRSECEEEVRLCALSNIYDLVMQDCIKMNGRVLINLLACLVDKNEIIRLKSRAAVLSYVSKKNPNLLYTCFIEVVFLFNKFIHLEDLGVFPLHEIDHSLLLLNGNKKRVQRYKLYQFFVQNIHKVNEVQLVMLLKQIVLMKHRLEKHKYRHSECGINTFVDLLYIFKLICEKQDESKTKFNKNGDGGGGKSGGKNIKNQFTMNDAIQMVETVLQVYPAFVKLIIEYDKTLQTAVDELTRSISTNFALLIENSKDKFWNEANNAGEKTSKQKENIVL